jgi:hypothetical protein
MQFLQAFQKILISSFEDHISSDPKSPKTHIFCLFHLGKKNDP